MHWQLSDRADPVARQIADRHYNRQAIGTPQFVPPGRCLVLRTPSGDAFWVTSWPFAEWVQHAWAGAWVCSAFRNEGQVLSSTLIREAVAATIWRWPTPPPEGFVTFIDRAKVKPKKDPGYCYRMAGWEVVGETQGGLLALGLKADAMPTPDNPLHATPSLLAPHA